MKNVIVHIHIHINHKSNDPEIYQKHLFSHDINKILHISMHWSCLSLIKPIDNYWF